MLRNYYAVIFRQEHWLCEDELNKLKAVNPDFSGFRISSIDTKSGTFFLAVHMAECVCILWRTSISRYTTVLKCDDKRITGCKQCTNNKVWLFFKVYLLFDDYIHYHTMLIYVVEESDTSSTSLVEYINAKVCSMFQNEF
jgi:hypothetical protein